ncbi:MAG: hypothetical protein QXV01_08640, partial [Candidatus Bathyarchaeia archaeon]
CIFSGDIKAANGILEMHKVFEDRVEKLMQELPQIPYLRAIISSLDNIADLGASIAEIAINRALERPSKEVEKFIRIVKHVRTLPLTEKSPNHKTGLRIFHQK